MGIRTSSILDLLLLHYILQQSGRTVTMQDSMIRVEAMADTRELDSDARHDDAFPEPAAARWLRARQPGHYDTEQQLLASRTVDRLKAKLSGLPSGPHATPYLPANHALFQASHPLAQAVCAYRLHAFTRC